jgi:hypothetical protein
VDARERGARDAVPLAGGELRGVGSLRLGAPARREGRIVKAALLELEVDEAVEDLAAVLARRAPASAGHEEEREDQRRRED